MYAPSFTNTILDTEQISKGVTNCLQSLLKLPKPLNLRDCLIEVYTGNKKIM